MLVRPSFLFSVFIGLIVPFARCAPATSQIIESIINGTIPSKTALPNITIVPNATQELTLTLISSRETIVFTFLADPYDPGDFRLTITNNDKIKSSQTTSFPTGQIIKFSLNTKKNIFSMTGNGVFRVSQTVLSKNYTFIIDQKIMIQNNVTVPIDPPSPPTKSISANSALYILAGILGGIFGFTILVKIGVSIATRKKRSVLPQTRAPTLVNERLARIREQMKMNLSLAPELAHLEQAFGSPGYKGSINLDERAMHDHEIDYLTPVKFRKDQYNSISSIDSAALRATTASTLSKLSSNGSLQNIGKGSIIFTRTDIEEIKRGKRKLTPEPKSNTYQHGDIHLKVNRPSDLEEIQEESSPVRKPVEANPTEMLTFGPEKPTRVKERAVTTKRKTKYQVSPGDIGSESDIFSHTNSRKFTFEQSQIRSTILSRTILSEECFVEKEKDEKYAKRFKPRQPVIDEEEIRNVVEEFIKKQGEEDQEHERFEREDEDSSADEDDDDCFQLPNYFCCMICLADKRNIIMHPCQHIFACKACSKKVMNTSRLCLLCAGTITAAHKLKK